MRTKQSFKNMAVGLIGQLLTLLLGMIAQTIFINRLGVEYSGLNNTFTEILTVFSMAEMGFGTAILFNLYKPIAVNDIPTIKSYMKIFKKVYSIIGCIVFSAGLLLAPFVKYLIKNPEQYSNLSLIFLLFVLDTGLSYFLIYRSLFINANQKEYIVKSVTYTFNVIKTLLQIAVLYMSRSFILYISVRIVCNLLHNIVIWFICNRMYPFLKENDAADLPKEKVRDLFDGVKAMGIYKVGYTLLSSTDNTIITKILGLGVSGFYGNYKLITKTLYTFLNTIFSAVIASLGNYNAVEDDESKHKMYKNINFANFWLFGFGSICCFVLLNPFITLWLGEDFTFSMPVVLLICLNMYLDGMNNASLIYRQTMGLFIYGKWRPVLTTIINLGLSIWLAHKWGIGGVFFGTTASLLLTNCWYDPYIIYKHGLKKNVFEYYARYIQYFVVIVLCTVTAWYATRGIQSLFGGLNVWSFICMAIACAIIPNVIMLIIYYKSDEFKFAFNSVKKLFSFFKRNKEQPEG